MNATSEIEILRARVTSLETENEILRDRARGSDEEQVYLASKTRHHFHRPGCKYGECIPSHKLIEFSSHRDLDGHPKPATDGHLKTGHHT